MPGWSTSTGNDMEQCNCQTRSPDKELDGLLEQSRDYEGALIPVLQRAQDIYGYLPGYVLERVATGLRLPLSQVYGVVTFYAQFHLSPRGKNIIRICRGTACHVRGVSRVADEMKKTLGVDVGGTTQDGEFTYEEVACIGACGLAPVMMVNDRTFGKLTPEKVGDILEQF